jgi:hypothetical protein
MTCSPSPVGWSRTTTELTVPAATSRRAVVSSTPPADAVMSMAPDGTVAYDPTVPRRAPTANSGSALVVTSTGPESPAPWMMRTRAWPAPGAVMSSVRRSVSSSSLRPKAAKV